MNSILSIIFTILCCGLAQAKLDIPKGLSKSDRRIALETLGLSTSFKVLGNPFPLGGFSGLEIGISSEVIPTAEIGSLGSKATTQGETSYSVLTLGKGLYNNFDIFVQMAPFSQQEDIRSFGGQLRWGFYQATYMPAHIAFVAHANSVSFQNEINISSTGYDLVGGFTVDDVTLYIGAGMVISRGLFIGGTGGITDTGQKESETVSDSHFISGIDLRFNNAFLALELDRYTESIYSAKLGLRF